VTSLKDDAEVINENDTERGYLLIGVETNTNLKTISIDGPRDIALSHEDLREGTNFILVPLMAGTYDVADIEMDYLFKFDIDDKEKWQFSIRPQTISYVGHLEIKTSGYFVRYARLELVNRSTEALDFMEQKFPSILDNRELHYGGPGNDDFFDYLQQLGE
jgi:hypothetical protein